MSLKQLFGIVAYCGVVAWCAAHVGYDNEMFLMVLIISLALSAVFFSLAQHEKLRSYAAVVVLPVFFFCVIPVFSTALLLNALLLSIVGIVCAYRPLLEKYTLSVIVLSCNSVAMVLGVMFGWAETSGFNDLRAAYPIVSLENRLEYELKSSSVNLPTDVKFSEEVLSDLDFMETSISLVDNGSFSRISQLSWLHNRQQEKFIQAQGFGITRMFRTREERLTLSPLQNIPMNVSDASKEDQGRYDWSAVYEFSQSSEIDRLHVVSKMDFIDPKGFGAVIEPKKQVAGFIEHAFHYSPNARMIHPDDWNVKRLLLVSLLKFAEPRVYELDHLPRMDQLSAKDVPTRPLDEFENHALEQLWSEKDIVISHENNNYRMLGSLRATKQCLECHSVERGTLLGAFSYDLTRNQPSGLSQK